MTVSFVFSNTIARLAADLGMPERQLLKKCAAGSFIYFQLWAVYLTPSHFPSRSESFVAPDKKPFFRSTTFEIVEWIDQVCREIFADSEKKHSRNMRNQEQSIEKILQLESTGVYFWRRRREKKRFFRKWRKPEILNYGSYFVIECN